MTYGGRRMENDLSTTERYCALLSMLSRRVLPFADNDLKQVLMQAGYLGLLQAEIRFDSTRGIQFTTYAVPWILGEMKRALRDELNSRADCPARKKLLLQEEALRLSLGRRPTVQELSAASGLDDASVVMLLDRKAERTVSIDDENGRYDSAWLSIEEKGYERFELLDALGRLDLCAQRLILLRYFRDYSQKETAILLGRSQSWVSKTEQHALKSLKRMLEEDIHRTRQAIY